MDAGRRVLTRDGQALTLTPKEFDTLLVLVEADGRVVDKEQLIARVWPDSYVGDGSLARNISVLRRTLGEEVIETHRRRGYRITLPVVSTYSQTPEVVQSETQTISSPIAPADVELVKDASSKIRHPGMFAFGLAAIVLIVFGTTYLVGIRTATAHATNPIHSILIEKNGALDPLNEGFTLHGPDGNYPHAMYNRETNGWDRWRLVTDDQNYYTRPLTADEKDFALQRDWKLTCVCALESGGGEADIDFAGKGPRFDIELLQEGNRYFVALTKQISPTIQVEAKTEFPGVADVAHPHTYELRYEHVSKTASLWIDGKQVASGYRGHYQFQEDRGLLFGVAIYGNVPKSSAVFRQVRFEAD